MLKLHTIMETTSATVFKLFNFTTCEGIFQTLNGHCVFLHDAAINSFSCFLGMYIILTNSWVFWILFTRPEDDDTSLSIILNLALADTFTGWMVIYDAVYNILQFTLYVECILRIGMFVCCSLASRFIVMLLTFERLIKISNTYTYRKYINITRAKVSLVMVWVLSTLVGLLPFFGWSSMNILHLCSFIRTMSDSYLAFILILHVTPFFFTLYAYIRMVAVVRRHASAIEQVWRGAGNRRSCTTRAVITTVIVVGVYFVCWAPMGMILFIYKECTGWQWRNARGN